MMRVPSASLTEACTPRIYGEQRKAGVAPVVNVPLMLNALRQLFLREAPEVGAAEPVTLESLLDRGWLELFYQPKIDLRTRRLVGAEGLIRARHPARGILPPAAFLPGANEQSLLAMTEYVIRTALRDWEAFAARGTP
jgi:EAL domain-containing protein (putative c-di-GMP-specific phosphodiesterase class I)